MELEGEIRGSQRLGHYLRRLRTGYGLSLRRVEDKARQEGGEIDNSQLSRYERGICYPSFDKLCLLANIFNVSIQNFSDLLELEKVEAFEPAESAGYEALRTDGNREWEQGNFARAYSVYEKALARLESGAEESVAPDVLARARFNLARSLLRMGKISLAETEQGSDEKRAEDDFAMLDHADHPASIIREGFWPVSADGPPIGVSRKA